LQDVELLKGEVKNDVHPAGQEFSRPRDSRRRVTRGEIDSRIQRILWEHPRGLTVDEVGRALALSRSSTARHLDALARKGEIDLQTYGQTRVFTLPRRISLSSTLGEPSPLVLVLSADLRILGVNEPFLSVFRLQREDLIGRRIGELPFAAFAGERLLGDLEAGTRGKGCTSEFESLIGDARYSFRARITPLASPQGASGIVLSIEDISGKVLHRKRLGELMDDRVLSLLSSNPQVLEEILERRRQEERMQIIQSSMNRAAMPAFWIGKDGRFLRVNPAAAMLLGYQEGELARMALADVDMDHPPGTWQSLWDSLKTGNAISFESRFRTKGGDVIRVDARASHVAHRDKEFGLLFAVDITGRREAEEALRDSEATLRAFFDANPDPSFLVDREGRLLLANHAAADLIGTDRPRLIGTSVFDAMPEKAEVAREALEEVLEKHRAMIYAEEIAGRFFSTVISPLADESGEVDRVAIFARDLTDRKQVEDALRHANERLNLLAAITCHDVLNDITALGMYLALLERGPAQGPGRELAGKLNPIVRNLQRTMEFTRDYADLGTKTASWEDAAGAVGRGVATIDVGPLRVDLHLPGLEIYADPLFERVVSNLVDNTLRHGEHATFIRFRAMREGEGCTLVVEDDGVGVPREKKESIFRPGCGRHSGFGLFLIREVLGITGMSIRENGEPGEGARFEIRISRGGFRLKDGAGDSHADG
jgi:PAS domain S-box-containing protein